MSSGPTPLCRGRGSSWSRRGAIAIRDLNQAVDFVRDQPGVVAVSMNDGGTECQDDCLNDSLYTTPAGHTGITFLASTGDDGAWPGAQKSSDLTQCAGRRRDHAERRLAGQLPGRDRMERQQGAGLHRGRLQPVRSRAVVSVPSPEQRPSHRPRRVDGRRSEYRLLGLLQPPPPPGRGTYVGRRWHQRLDVRCGPA